MFNAKSEFVNTKTVLCFPKTLLFLVAIVTGAFAVPVHPKYFPEQDLPPASVQEDGAAYMDKIFLMKVLNTFERQTAVKHGLTKARSFMTNYVFEGDIVLQKHQAINLLKANQKRKKRKLDADVTSAGTPKKWKLPINYLFDGSHTAEQQADIKQGVYHWEDQTCITFTNNQTSDTKSIRFIDNSGCYSYVGYTDDQEHQNISIGESCTRKGIVAHEIGHALGFWHEHAREDREDHLQIVWDNIIIGQAHNFEMKSWEIINNLAVPYDLGSVMHYSGHQFAKGNLVTIESLNPLLQHTMGQREELSFYDVKLANLAYCNETCSPFALPGTCQNDGYQDPKNCSRCRCPEGLAGDFCQLVAPSNDDCGGVIELTSGPVNITSPNFPKTYDPGLKCYWLLKSPNGTAIRLQFQLPLMSSPSCDSSQPYLPCDDFVEVRFTDNLGFTGGRFCCNDSVQTEVLSNPIITHTNHALILFRTFEGMYRGFSVEASVESCGGCSNSSSTEPQIPCYKKVWNNCTQTWQKVVKEGCTYSFWGTCHTKYVLKTFERQTKCLTETPYCCQGFELSDDEEFCTKKTDGTSSDNASGEKSGNTDDNDSGSWKSNDGSDDNNSDKTNDSNRSSDTKSSDDSSGRNSDESSSKDVYWSPWSGWSDCSVTCGGCGVQVRSRTCPQDDACGNRDSETQECGYDSCNLGNTVKTCAKTERQSYSCGFFSKSDTCYRTVTSYYTQSANCCCGYEVDDGDCVESDRRR